MARVRSKTVARRGAVKAVLNVKKTSVIEKKEEENVVAEEMEKNDEKMSENDQEMNDIEAQPEESQAQEDVQEEEECMDEGNDVQTTEDANEEEEEQVENEELEKEATTENEVMDEEMAENEDEDAASAEESEKNADVEEDIENKKEEEDQQPTAADDSDVNETMPEDDVNDEDLGMFKASLKKRTKKESKKGVVYMSRVPPFMTPDRVRQMLKKYGDIERIYLVEEDKTHRKKRIKSGGNKKVNFTEGWIEFTHKSVAKRVAAALNTKPMGGKKRSMYYDDIWNLKYLKGFKWSHLTEKIAYENRVRDQKLRLEIAQAAKENAAFLERVEQSKQIDKMEERKKAEDVAVPAPLENIRRTFRQHTPADKTKQASLGQESKALLTKVFKKRKHQETA